MSPVQKNDKCLRYKHEGKKLLMGNMNWVIKYEIAENIGVDEQRRVKIKNGVGAKTLGKRNVVITWGYIFLRMAKKETHPVQGQAT